MPLPHVSETLQDMLTEFAKNRDSEIEALSFVLPQYVTDHTDRDAYRAIDRQVNQLARALDRMIVKLEKWVQEARKIESSVDNLYGE